MFARRTFLKTLVGAFVASAIEVGLAREQDKWVHQDKPNLVAEYAAWLQQVVQGQWESRYQDAFQNMPHRS